MDVSVSKLLEISSILFADLEKEDRSYFRYLAFLKMQKINTEMLSYLEKEQKEKQLGQ